MKKRLLRSVLVLIAGLGMLAAASTAQAAVPSLLGTWQWTSNEVRFDNVLVDGAAPVYEATTGLIKITSQKGRLFAGRMKDGEHELKITGFVDTDNTVTMQIYNYHSRGFFSGILTLGTPPTLRGTGQFYEEISLSSNPNMVTGLLTLKKVSG